MPVCLAIADTDIACPLQIQVHGSRNPNRGRFKRRFESIDPAMTQVDGARQTIASISLCWLGCLIHNR